jgi:integrase
LAGLQVGDVRLWLSREVWSGTLAVRRTKRKLPGGWFTDTPKSNRSTRDVSLPSRIAEAPDAYFATHPNRHDPIARLFPNRKRDDKPRLNRG